jgi:hypothetical protein
MTHTLLKIKASIDGSCSNFLPNQIKLVIDQKAN